MFSRFIKNKILSALVLISSLSYGAQSKNTVSDERSHQDKQQECSPTSLDKIYINGQPFYIPPEEPSLEERKKKAVLMYWEHLDPKTGKITVIKYPDTLKVKEEEPTQLYDDSDLTPWPWFKPNKSVSVPVIKQEAVVKEPLSITNSVVQVKPVETKISSPDPLDEILERLEAEEAKTQQVESKENVPENPPVAEEHLTQNLTTESCPTNTAEVKQLLDALEEDQNQKPLLTSATNTSEVVSQPALVSNVNTTVVSDTDIQELTNALPKISYSAHQNTQEIEELLALLEEEQKALKITHTNQTEVIQSPVLTNSSLSVHCDTPVQPQPVYKATNKETRDFDELLAALDLAGSTSSISKTDTLKTKELQSKGLSVIPKKFKNSQDDLDELLKDLEKEGVSNQQSSHQPQDLPIRTSGIVLPALGGSALLGMSRLRRRKKKSVSQINLIPNKPVSKKCVEKRHDLANKLKAIRTIEDIKNQRKLLSKQLRLARANNDEQTIQSILDTRKELTQKRRQACLCITDPYTARIKEERRLLTKKMTLARKRKDIQTMAQITQQREQLKDEVKSLNAYIRNFNYTQKRSSFLKAKTLKVILSHQRS